jgi:tRNA pseudouridine55 synthase
MIDGILLINKEVGITSYDVIRRLKKILPKGQKIGHAGTLDPFASGLLIILLGKSTKQMEKILKMEKEYIVKAGFGYCTDTQDSTGEKINVSNSSSPITEKEILREIQQNFLGEIRQMPPQYSAKKIAGRKAYEYARENEKVILDAKQIHVYDFKLLNYEWPYVEFNIICSSGTYIRTLINDLGENLGVYATAIELVRTRIGEFTLKDSAKSENINEEMELNLVNLNDA